MRNSFHRNGKFVAFHNEFSKIPPSTSTQFETLVQRLRVFVWFDGYFFLWGQQRPKCETVIRHPNYRLFCKFHPSSNLKNKNKTELVLDSQIDLCQYPFGIRHVFIRIFPPTTQWSIFSPTKIFNFLLNHPVYCQGYNNFISCALSFYKVVSWLLFLMNINKIYPNLFRPDYDTK